MGSSWFESHSAVKLKKSSTEHEVVVEKTENSIGDDESSPNSVKSESAISSATEDDRKSSDTDSGKNYSDIDSAVPGYEFGWLHPFLSRGAHAGFIHAGMGTSNFITLLAIRSIATVMATTPILMKTRMIWSHVTVQSHLLAGP
uniref:Uncharacterized protein n=1 Tax=Timema cristinae TaxID=61476 RepID=A0A7R9CGB5_TIMCR|nr:unnamed protein product [Timema cristinae]